MNATIQHIQETSPDDGWGGDYELLQNLQASKQPVEVLGVECRVDGTFERDYHNIMLPCGRKIVGISGYHLCPKN
jgi:hypothetical protein